MFLSLTKHKVILKCKTFNGIFCQGANDNSLTDCLQIEVALFKYKTLYKNYGWFCKKKKYTKKEWDTDVAKKRKKVRNGVLQRYAMSLSYKINWFTVLPQDPTSNNHIGSVPLEFHWFN